MLYLSSCKAALPSRALGWGAMAMGLLLGSQTGCGESMCDMAIYHSTIVQLEAMDGWIPGAVYELQVTDANSSISDSVECAFRWSDGQEFSCGNSGLDTAGGVLRLNLHAQTYRDVRVVLASNGSTLLDASLKSDKSTEETCAGPRDTYAADFSFDHSTVDGKLPTIPLCIDCPDGYASGEVGVSCFCSDYGCPGSKEEALAPRPGERVEVTSCDGVDLISWPDADNPQVLAYAGNTIRDFEIELVSGACLDQPHELRSTGFREPSGCDETCVVSAGMISAARGACLTEQEVEEGLSDADRDGAGGAVGR